MTATEMAQGLSLVMSAFASSQNQGQFKLVQGKTALHVLPVHSAILERPITVTANDTPALAAVHAVLVELARASGQKNTNTYFLIIYRYIEGPRAFPQ